MDIKKYLPKIQENVSLAEHTTFRIGGPARYFFTAESKDNLIKAVKIAKEFNLPFFILGKGSNVLFSDKGFKGIVIKTQNSPKESLWLPTGQAKLPIGKPLASYGAGKTGRRSSAFSGTLRDRQNHNSKLKTVYAEAGVALKDLVDFSVKQSLSEAEWMAGIPGVVGGAIFGNAQAFYKKMSDIIERVEVFDAQSLNIKNFLNKQCQFSVKNSIFKKYKNLIILSAVLKLKKGDKKEIEKKIKEHLNYRKDSHVLNLPSAGSIFINPTEKGKVIPSGFLIDKCDLKGKKIGEAQISEKHGNFIVNLGNAKSSDVVKLIELIKKKVKQKFGILLKEEIRIVL